MADSVYWIWFQLVFGIGTRRAELMTHFFGNPQVIAEGIGSDRRITGMLEQAELENARPAMEHAKSIKQRTLKKGCEIITPDSDDYPPLLGDIYSRPAALYIKGGLSCLRGSLCIAMVGSREPTEYGLAAAKNISFGLAEAGAVIISGLANGIDSESHKAALEAGAKTIGVLGCGIDVDYPKRSSALKRAISENGAVITEFPLGYQPQKYHFPIRNRIISGMSHGIVVVEAGINSGSLITADHALEQGRDVFAVPGSIFSEGHEGANKLIKEGAKAVTCAADVFEEYGELVKIRQKPNKRESPFIYSKENISQEEILLPDATAVNPAREIPPELSDMARAALESITHAPAYAEEIAAAAGLEAREVLSSLTELEIYGLIRMHPGRRFSLL